MREECVCVCRLIVHASRPDRTSGELWTSRQGHALCGACGDAELCGGNLNSGPGRRRRRADETFFPMESAFPRGRGDEPAAGPSSSSAAAARPRATSADASGRLFGGPRAPAAPSAAAASSKKRASSSAASARGATKKKLKHKGDADGGEGGEIGGLRRADELTFKVRWEAGQGGGAARLALPLTPGLLAASSPHFSTSHPFLLTALAPRRDPALPRAARGPAQGGPVAAEWLDGAVRAG